MKDKTLILIRHGHRDTSQGRENDNSLSDRGKDQAKAVSRYFRTRFAKEEPVLLSSPKVRCIETLLPLADKLACEVKVKDILDEQHEAGRAFDRRVAKFFEWWKSKAPECVIICSHGDWIPTFTRIAIGTEVDVKKGGWLEIETKQSQVRLRWLLQKLP